MHLPKQARTIPVRGKGDDAGKWFKCWNCGFICNIDRDDSSGGYAGDNHTEFIRTAPAEGVDDRMLVFDSPPFYHTLMEASLCSTTIETDEIGLVPLDEYTMIEEECSDSLTIRHEFESDITKGCPFCGTTNWRG